MLMPPKKTKPLKLVRKCAHPQGHRNQPRGPHVPPPLRHRVPTHNASASEFTASWDVTLVASNPNHKLDIYYDTLQAAIFYNANRSDSYRPRVLLATKPLPPPSALRTRAETTCSFRIEAASAYIGDDMAKEISEGRARGMVRFELTLLAMYKFPNWYWTYPKLFAAWCNPVEFGFSLDNWIGTAQSSACEENGDLSRLVLQIAR
ncbi:hypothetical protein L3X38_043539 [Prunus dulcis]|uniref:Late embryogenesis abundant protein LEA-2 subgroup domain-containing protein n=1 Tax=Prunus dulcis TaxID=3755 RepID=A0AAD4YN20_PRUDU|nr:hypothetical protein L3X38_043539 [Prunus dulcis]